MGATQKGRSDLKLASLRDDRDTLERAHELARELASGSLSALPELIDELRLFVDEEEAHFLFSA
jgi:RecG-like helicase